MRSIVLRKILAASTEEPTTTGKEPNLRSITGPYCRESWWMERCGSGPIRLRLPITGHGFGPGGRFSFFCGNIFFRMCNVSKVSMRSDDIAMIWFSIGNILMKGSEC